jgi:hypothetical protein
VAPQIEQFQRQRQSWDGVQQHLLVGGVGILIQVHETVKYTILHLYLSGVEMLLLLLLLPLLQLPLLLLGGRRLSPGRLLTVRSRRGLIGHGHPPALPRRAVREEWKGHARIALPFIRAASQVLPDPIHRVFLRAQPRWCLMPDARENTTGAHPHILSHYGFALTSPNAKRLPISQAFQDDGYATAQKRVYSEYPGEAAHEKNVPRFLQHRPRARPVRRLSFKGRAWRSSIRHTPPGGCPQARRAATLGEEGGGGDRDGKLLS